MNSSQSYALGLFKGSAIEDSPRAPGRLKPLRFPFYLICLICSLFA